MALREIEKPARKREEDEAGRRYWLFREGLYGGGAEPHWFMHGVFA